MEFFLKTGAAAAIQAELPSRSRHDASYQPVSCADNSSARVATVKGGAVVKKHLVRIALGPRRRAGVPRPRRHVVFDSRRSHSGSHRLRRAADLTMPVTDDAAQADDPRIVILDIDEKSLAEPKGAGRGGATGSRLLLDKLFDDYHVQVVGFDVVFAERDESSGLRVLRELAGNGAARTIPRFNPLLPTIAPQARIRRHLRGEDARAAGRARLLLHAASRRSDSRITQAPCPNRCCRKGVFQGRNIRSLDWTGYGANLPELQTERCERGALQPAAPTTTAYRGACRCSPSTTGAYYEPLSLAMVRLLLGSARRAADLRRTCCSGRRTTRGSNGSQSGTLRIPVDDRSDGARSLSRPEHSFQVRLGRRRSARQARLQAELKGKIVLVGTTAPGLLDLRATPVGVGLSGGRNSRQPDRRHARRHHQAKPALRRWARNSPCCCCSGPSSPWSCRC